MRRVASNVCAWSCEQVLFCYKNMEGQSMYAWPEADKTVVKQREEGSPVMVVDGLRWQLVTNEYRFAGGCLKVYDTHIVVRPPLKRAAAGPSVGAGPKTRLRR